MPTVDRIDPVPLHHPPVLELPRLAGPPQQFAEWLGTMLVQIVGGVLPPRQSQRPQIDLLCQKLRQRPLGGVLPRLVPVEHQHHPPGEPPQQRDVALVQRRPQRADHVLQPVLMRDNAVGVPLGHHRQIALGHPLAGFIEPVQQLALLEQRVLVAVEILRPLLVPRVGQNPSAKRDRPALRVANRKQHAVHEAVVKAPPPLPLADQLDRRQLLGPVLPPGPVLQPVPVIGMKPQPKPHHRLVADPPITQVLPRPQGNRIIDQALVELPLGPGDQFVVPHAGVAVLSRFAPRHVPGHFEPRLLRQQLERFAEPHPVPLHDEGETVAPQVAHPAAKALPVGVDVHRRIAVVMKRTQPDIVAPSPLRTQRDRLRDQRQQINSAAHLLFEIVRQWTIHVTHPFPFSRSTLHPSPNPTALHSPLSTRHSTPLPSSTPLKTRSRLHGTNRQ